MSDALADGGPGLQLPAGAKRFVTLSDVRVYGFGKQIVVRVKVSGKKQLQAFELTGYFTATPHLEGNRIVFSDAKLTAETETLLGTFGVELNAADLGAEFVDKLVVDLSEPVAKARSSLKAAMNRKVGSVQLAGDLNDFRLVGVRSAPDEQSVVIDALMQGTLSASVN